VILSQSASATKVRALLLTGSICDREVIPKICIFMLRSDKILHYEGLSLHCNDGRQC